MKTVNAKILPLEPWIYPPIEKSILSKLTLEELDYLKERKIFNETDKIKEV